MEERKFIKKLVGENIYLSPISLDDVEEYTHHVNNLRMSVGLGGPVYTGVTDYEEELRLLKTFKEMKYQFAVRRVENDELLGNIGFNSIDNLHKTAVLGIMLANEKYQHQGYGTEAMNLLLDFGFSLLNLKNIYLTVFEYNKIAYNLYKKVGFKEIGRRRKAVEIMGKRYDIIMMDILSDEFESKFIKKEIESRYEL